MTTETEQLSEKEQDALFEAEYNKAIGLPSETPPVKEPAAVETPVEDTVEDATPAQETAPQPAESQADPNAWMKDIPDEARARYLKEMQDFRANASRNAALQRHLEDARRQLQELKKPKEEAPAEPKLDKWEALAETDKELAVSVEQRIADAVAKATSELEKKFHQRVAPIEQQNYDSYVQNELHMLKQAVPNYEEVVRDPHFHDWLEVQSPLVRQKYAESIDHRDALDVLKLYSFSFGYPPAPEATSTLAPNPVADKVAAARETRRQASTPIRSNAAGIPRNPNTETLTDKEADEVFEAAFAKYTNRG